MIDALVLAGSPNDGLLKDCSSAKFEALIPIGERTMVEYVVEALRQSKKIGQVVVVGPRELSALLSPRGVKVVAPKKTVMENIYYGFQHLPNAQRALVVTSDIPLITSETIDNFINLCGDCKSDLYFPAVPKDAVEKKFPLVKRTYVKLREGTFTGGNVFMVNPAVVPKCLDIGQRFVEMRKSPLKLCGMLGVKFLIKFITNSLTLEEVEQKASAVLGIRGRVVICSFPELGVDIDKPSDLSLAMEALGVST
ncbi:GTP:adenosylcobinamide-phosphate guanylyltransferase [Desulfohalotomaculum tongense]|uniref:nucleotidyltransferase family protein n=1 Tax=Desulforadius tongensis TaxID=1216062 RepID=UPI001957EF3A|nr:nucleotidyltransferase family protein [Desulforadius tongensis]MBM7855202.1 GTP:adenosylcobinamide-phosphate guanylyltransferase [Desulforadius tongensis]